jgi:hypothetical protein
MSFAINQNINFNFQSPSTFFFVFFPTTKIDRTKSCSSFEDLSLLCIQQRTVSLYYSFQVYHFQSEEANTIQIHKTFEKVNVDWKLIKKKPL